MSHAVEAVDAAASALHQGTWTPADLELSLARDFLAHRDALDPRLLPAMPPSPSPQGWVTQHVLWLEDVAQLADAFLTGWRPWLADGHMVALLTAYATLARTATPWPPASPRTGPPNGRHPRPRSRPPGGRTGTSPRSNAANSTP